MRSPKDARACRSRTCSPAPRPWSRSWPWARKRDNARPSARSTPSSPKKPSGARSEESRCDHVNQPTNDKLGEEGTASMKLTTVTHVSVDGVMQGLGGADEARRGGIGRGGWGRAPFVDEGFTSLHQGSK